MSEVNLEFSLDYLNILENDNDIMIVQIDLLHLGINRNKCNISRNCIERSLPTFFNKPIIYRLNNNFFWEESTDFLEHARTEQQEKTIFIGGTIPESSPVEFIERDGKTYLRMVGVIHKLYQKTLYSILENRDGEVKISIELKVIDGEQNKNGILDIKEFKLLGICLLGTNVIEGIENSNLTVTKFSLNDYNNFYLSFTKKPITNFPKQGDNKEISLKNSNYVQFDYEYALKIKEEYPSIWHSGGEDFGNQAFEYWTKARKGEDSQNVKNWIKRRESFAARHHKDVNLAGIVANMKWGSIVKNGEKYMRNIIQEAIDKIKEKESEDVKNVHFEKLEFISKEEIGSKPAIKINKSKEAMSNSAWGNEDKSILKKECLMASNYKALCKSVFLRVEKEYLEGKEGALGYPVMEKKDNEVVYNRNGLASARAYATQNNESDILSELKSIYRHLGLTWDDEKDGENVNKNAEKKLEKDEDVKVNALEDKAEEKDKTTSEEEKEEKEEEKDKEEEVKNACSETEHVDGCSCKNSSEEKSQMESCKNCMAMEEELNSVKNELMKYKRAEEEQKMSYLLETYSHCFSMEEKKEMSNEISKYSYVDFEKKINSKAIEFALKAKDKTEEKKEEKEDIKNTLSFSVSPFIVNKPYDFSKNGEVGLDDIINNSGVKMKK